MERRLGRIADPFHFHIARQILQKGLQLNPGSGCLAQVRHAAYFSVMHYCSNAPSYSVTSLQAC
jgi:hypothetical protein